MNALHVCICIWMNIDELSIVLTWIVIIPYMRYSYTIFILATYIIVFKLVSNITGLKVKYVQVEIWHCLSITHYICPYIVIFV